jgi:ABC-type nitrate/sulfonate/bicarbonate transport system substrate-binding protein
MSGRIDRRAFVGALAAASFAPRAVRAQSLPAGPPPPAGAIVLNVGCALDDQTTPLLYAQSAGLFAKNGLDVRIARLNSGAAIAAAIAGGTLQLGKSSILNLIVAHARAIPFALVAPSSIYRSDKPDGGLIVAPASKVKGAKDLAGAVIGVASLADLNAIATQDWIDQNGGDSTLTKFVEMSPAATAAAIDQARIDGATLWNPILTQAVGGGHARFAAPVFDAIGKRYQVAAWFADVDWVAKNRPAVDRFTAAMHQANVFVAAHENETTGLIASFLGLDPAALGAMARSTPAPYLSAQEIDPVIAMAVKYKKIPASFSAADMISDAALKPA